MQKKVIHLSVASLLLAGMLFNSMPPVREVQAASKTRVTQITRTIKKGKTYKISKKVYKISIKRVKFSSANKKVATVSKKGVIKAKKVGKATITVRDKKVKKKIAVFKVNVKKVSNKKDDNVKTSDNTTPSTDSTTPPLDNTVQASDDSSVTTKIGEYYTIKSPSGISFDKLYTYKCVYNKSGFLEDWYIIYSKNDAPEAMYEVLVCETNKKAVQLQGIYGGTVDGNCIVLFSDKEAAINVIKKFGKSNTTGFLEILAEQGYTSVG